MPYAISQVYCNVQEEKDSNCHKEPSQNSGQSMLPQTLKPVLIKQDTANSQTVSVLLMQVTTSQCMATTYACYLHAAGVHPMHGHATRRSRYSACQLSRPAV